MAFIVNQVHHGSAGHTDLQHLGKDKDGPKFFAIPSIEWSLCLLFVNLA